MAADFFLKIDGIPGESIDSKHKDEIELASWSWGESQTGSAAKGGGLGAGKVQMQDFHFAMGTNKASPKLFLNCANGMHIKKAELTCRKAGGDQLEYLKFFFEDLLVSSFQIGASGGGDGLPMEQVSFNFTKIKFQYAAQKADGKLDAPIVHQYDIKMNKGG
jgi:type VI secretion system secreted protein Hcp